MNKLGGFVIVSSDWLKEHIDDKDLIILDSRPKISYSYGHVPKAQSITVEQVIKTDEYGSHLVCDENHAAQIFSSLGIDDQKTVVVYGDPMDPSSTRIAWTLLYFGHEKTCLLNSTINELQTLGIELSRKSFQCEASTFVPNTNKKIRITSDSLQNSLDNFTIIDARTPQEFMGGHIPKSILIPFTDGISFQGKLFHETNYLKEMFSKNNISNDNEIVCYCMHGHRASSLFFQLKLAGFEKVMLYDGSFVEWYGKKLPLE